MSRPKLFETKRRRVLGWTSFAHSWGPRAVVAAMGGAVAAISWLPPHRPEFLVLGVAMILLAIRSAREWGEVLAVGLIGSIVFFAIAARPLVSAHVWGGWISEESPVIDSPEWWLLNLLWVLLTVWGSLFWTVTLAFYWVSRTEPTWMRVVGLATVWAGIGEWLRSITTWGFEWGFLGIAVVEVSTLRHWSSVGGVFLLSSLVVGVSALLVELVAATGRRRAAVAGAIFAVVGVVWLIGSMLDGGANEAEGVEVEVAAFQFAPPVPAAGTTVLGVSPDWLEALRQAVEREYRLIVLPESISSHAVQLDETPAALLGSGRQVSAGKWRQELTPLLLEREAFLALGIEGVERGATYNSMTVWGEKGLIGWQHKVRLVPFAEYLPWGWGFLAARSLTYYRAGENLQPIDAGPFRLGSFICQEVQHSGVSRDLVSRGANLLISGGNDGVFADSRVAEVHHSMARIRAAEVGRYLVRAMKSGVTSIIDPSGEVLGRAPGSGPALVADTVFLSARPTLWTRFGVGPLLLGTLGFLVRFLLNLGRSRQKPPV